MAQVLAIEHDVDRVLPVASQAARSPGAEGMGNGEAEEGLRSVVEEIPDLAFVVSMDCVCLKRYCNQCYFVFHYLDDVTD